MAFLFTKPLTFFWGAVIADITVAHISTKSHTWGADIVYHYYSTQALEETIEWPFSSLNLSVLQRRAANVCYYSSNILGDLRSP